MICRVRESSLSYALGGFLLGLGAFECYTGVSAWLDRLGASASPIFAFAMMLIFFATGAAFLFLRHRVVIDNRVGRIETNRLFFLPFPHHRQSLSDFDRIVIREDGNRRYPYTVVLSGPGGAVEINSHKLYRDAALLAEAIARHSLLRLEEKDGSQPHPAPAGDS